jgi:hypothetical protein
MQLNATTERLVISPGGSTRTTFTISPNTLREFISRIFTKPPRSRYGSLWGTWRSRAETIPIWLGSPVGGARPADTPMDAMGLVGRRLRERATSRHSDTSTSTFRPTKTLRIAIQPSSRRRRRSSSNAAIPLAGRTSRNSWLPMGRHAPGCLSTGFSTPRPAGKPIRKLGGLISTSMRPSGKCRTRTERSTSIHLHRRSCARFGRIAVDSWPRPNEIRRCGTR